MEYATPDRLAPGLPRSRFQLRDEVIAYVRESIVSGRLPPGTRLPLAALAEQIGTSATPVREGLLALVHDGWVVQEINRGFRVAVLERQDVVDAYVAHAFLAGELAARAAEEIDDGGVRRLRELNDAMASQGPEPTDDAHVEALNHEFHKLIYATADSRRLLWFLEAAARFVPRRFWPTIPGWNEFNAAGHDQIVAALADHDPERARTAMCRHIQTASALLLAHLDGISFWSKQEDAS